MEREIIYIADPMCSWCWGFAPVIKKLKEEYESKWNFKLIMGGLSPDETEPISKDMLSTLAHHWGQVRERSGQNFSEEILKNDQWVYNTEPACRAVVVARDMHPEKAIEFLHDVQETFYVLNMDMMKKNTYLTIAKRYGWDVSEFEKKFDSDEFKQKTREDFALARAHQASGFPFLAVRLDDEYFLVSKGWSPYENVDKVIRKIEEAELNTTE